MFRGDLNRSFEWNYHTLRFSLLFPSGDTLKKRFLCTYSKHAQRSRAHSDDTCTYMYHGPPEKTGLDTQKVAVVRGTRTSTDVSMSSNDHVQTTEDVDMDKNVGKKHGKVFNDIQEEFHARKE